MRIVLPLVAALLSAIQPGAAELPVDYNRDVRPILAKSCFACHGPDEKARKAKLRLDTQAGAEKDLGDGVRALVPGQPDKSELIYRIETDDPDDVMPPPDAEHALSKAQQQVLRAWVQQGGVYDEHWSFVLPEKIPLARDIRATWPQHRLDHFVLTGLESAKLSPAPPADRYQLIRRLSLDLIGLPTTPEEADAFVNDDAPDALSKVVDRLLASPHFGEHWARMWLDLARYADTRGYEKDKHRDMWAYRDWVINALNTDMSLDDFTRQQLAGDLIAPQDATQVLATAFHRNTMTNEEGGTDNEEFRIAAVKDRVDTTIQVWMGLTMGCAKCHTHKYDPISIQDYYSFYAFFNQTEDNDNEAPSAPTPTPAQARELAESEARLQTLNQKKKARSEALTASFEEWKKTTPQTDDWSDLQLIKFQSKHAHLKLEQLPDGSFSTQGRTPDKDTWVIDLQTKEEAPLTAIRLTTLPKKPRKGGPSDLNVVVSEFKLQIISPDGEAQPIALKNPRADFSQNNWHVSKAIDGNRETGWAFSPNKDVPHAIVFDLEQAVKLSPGAQLRLTIDQQYGQQLVLHQFCLLISTQDPATLTTEVRSGNRLVSFLNKDPDYAALKIAIGEVEAEIAGIRKRIPKTLVMRELPLNRQRKTMIHNRGNFLDPGEVVAPAVPVVFGAWPQGAPTNRLGIAEWLLQPDNPLTDRVFVNRIWARLFGVGIVETEEDFGLQGLSPSHPELLDWLAVDFRENGRSLKDVLRTLVSTATYQQSSQMRFPKADPNNRLFTRGARFRLSAEAIRDQALAVSGLLTPTIGGPSVMPPQPDGVWKTTYSADKWVNATGPNRYRRGLYTYLKRTSPYPSLTTFDAGSGETCQIRRVRTNTPLQALITLNDPVFVEAAGALAKRMQAAGSHPTASITRGVRLALIRPPHADEVQKLTALHQALAELYAAAPEESDMLLATAGLKPGEASAALVGVANAILNLDELVMKP